MFPSSRQESKNALELIQFGARFEDDRQAIQALYHFYDPANAGRGLTLRSRTGSLTTPGMSSPDWALEDRGDAIDLLGQRNPFSYKQSRQYFFDALTASTKTERDRRWGLTFQSLGHVLHHLQDMSQPQHSRNDMHCDYLPCQLPGQILFEGVYRVPAYENYTLEAPDDRFSGYQPVYSKQQTNGITAPRMFWHTEIPGEQASGKGIAEFSNVNFVTDGSNFIMEGNVAKANPRYSLPVPAGSKDASIDSLFPDQPIPAALKAMCKWDTAKCFMTFYSTAGRDNLTGQAIENDRGSTYSLFDTALEQYGATVQSISPPTGEGYSTRKVFSLNRFNFDRMQEILLPRAVGYSAGMINYFFRGEIDLEKANDSAGGYMVRNKVAEPMAGRFALYYDDAQDNRRQIKDASGQPIEWNTATYAGGVLAAGASMRVPDFPIPTNPAPKAAGEFMLVFNGDMGGETRAMFGNGAIGAVVAQKIEVQKNGGLYILASQGFRDVTLRVDKSGTNIVQPGEFNPYDGIIADDDNSGVGDPSWKFARFKPGIGGGMGYEVTAFGISAPNKPRLQVKNSAGAFQFSPRFIAWHATSGDSEYEFSLDGAAYGEQTLYWVRRYTENGQRREVSGTAVWPSLAISVFGSARGVLSADGLRFGEFGELFVPETRTVTQGGVRTVEKTQNIQYRTAVISLGATPTVSFESRIAEYDYRKETFDNTQLATTSSSPMNIQFCNGSSGVSLADETRQREIFTSQSRGGFRSGIGVFSGEPAYVSQQTTESAKWGIDEQRTVQQLGCMGGKDASHFWGAGEAWDTLSNTTSIQFAGGNRNDSSIVVNAGIRPPGGASHYFGNYGTAVRSGYDVICTDQPGCPPPFVQNGTSQSGTGLSLVRPLTGRPEDAIFLENSRVKFRQLDLTGVPYIAETSPLGEIFVATKDGQRIIHEPQNTMPVFSLPAGITKLKRAIWL